MGFCILENGQALLDFDMDEGFKCGKMGVNMKATGHKGRLMGEEDLCLQMAIYMRATSLTIKWKDKVSTSDQIGQSIEEIGKPQSKKVQVLKYGQTELNLQANTKKDLKQGEEFSDGVRRCNTKVNSLITTFMDSGSLNGMMGEYTRDTGSKMS